MRTVTLGEVCAITMGQAPVGDSYNQRGEGVPLIAGAGDFDGRAIRPSKFTTKPGKISATGDIVLSIRASIGAKVWANGEYCLGRGVAGLRHGPHLDGGYLWHWLSRYEHELASKGRGATFLQVSRADIADMRIELPTLPEQRRIAAILDSADALRTKRRQVLAHLDALTQSIFHDMFGQAPATVPLSETVEEFRYGTSIKSGVGGYPTLRIPNVIGGAIDTGEIKTVDVGHADLRRLTVRDGDLLFVRTNGNPDNVGRAAVFSGDAVGPAGFGHEPWIYASYLIRARLKPSFVPVFVAAYLASSDGRKQLRERAKTSAGQYNINTEALASIRIPDVPPERQRVFAEINSQVMTQRTSVVRLAGAHDEIFASLQARAFDGRL